MKVDYETPLGVLLDRGKKRAQRTSLCQPKDFAYIGMNTGDKGFLNQVHRKWTLGFATGVVVIIGTSQFPYRIYYLSCMTIV